MLIILPVSTLKNYKTRWTCNNLDNQMEKVAMKRVELTMSDIQAWRSRFEQVACYANAGTNEHYEFKMNGRGECQVLKDRQVVFNSEDIEEAIDTYNALF